MKKITHQLRKWRSLAAIFLLAAFASNVQAQNVTIRANNGSTVAAVKNGGVGDTFFAAGGFATWQHEQLSMVLTTSDGTALTPNLQLDNPANNLFSDADGHMQIGKGQVNNANVCYVTLSLPKGYRFTGYEIKFSKVANDKKGQYQDQGGNWTDLVFNTTAGESSTFGETNRTFETYTTSANVTTGGASQTISRTEMNAGEMGNVLYFKLQNPSSSRALITLESAEFKFTAEENYSPVTPAAEIPSPVSAVDVPFATSRVDFGTIESRTYQGVERVSYSSASVTDLTADFKLYEAESTTAGTDLDNISGQVVDYKAGTISSEGGYFKLGRTDKEQVYFIESPTTVKISDNHEVPVGYRIIAAEFEYAKKILSSRTFYITYTHNGTKYYLYTNGSSVSWETSNRRRTTWEMDADGYISTNGYYLYFNNGYAAVQRSKPGESERFSIGDDGIYQKGWPDYYIRFYVETHTGIFGYQWETYDCLISKDNGYNAVYEERSTSSTGTGTTDFTLNLYDKTGKKVEKSFTVNDSKPNGTWSIKNLNNDAVKFGVKGIGLVRATLTLQALDPYLDRMNVICQDEEQTEVRMSQTFTASDFSVNGGEFYFYLPKDCEDHQVAITFEDLFSKYFDESYTGGNANHTSRINFVKSDHYDAFGETDNSLYNDTAEAANAQKERLKVETVGTKKFMFNNAEEVGKNGGTLREFPFSLTIYKNEGGNFKNQKFTVSGSDQVDTCYVFTTDETRYNIAPTTATQHRAYAYYQMIVHVQSALYEPEVEFVPIYKDAVYYLDEQKDKDGNVTVKAGDYTGDFYGAVVTAMAGGQPGYSSTQEIFKVIDEAIKAGKDSKGNTDVPDNANKLLYLDFSQLAGVYQITDTEHESMEDFSATNAANCMIFLPKGHSAPNDNVAYKTDAGSFYAANNIVLTDKQPFYSPYDIQVGPENYARYERKITWNTQGKNTLQTVMLPFTLTVSGGLHTEEDGTAFNLSQMTADNCLEAGDESVQDFYGKAHFTKISGSLSEANVPYMVDVTAAPEDAGTPFKASQKAALVKATKGAIAEDYTVEGESASGTIGTGSYTFQNYATYSGKDLTAADGYFYYAGGKYLNSKNIRSSVSKILRMYPFRSYFAYTATGNAKDMKFMEIVFGENETSGIDAFASERAEIDQNAPVYDLQGRMIAPSMNELNGKKLMRGIYVVNGVKIIVK